MTDEVKIALAPYHCMRICSLDLTVKSEVAQLSKLRAVMNAVVNLKKAMAIVVHQYWNVSLNSYWSYLKTFILEFNK